MRTEPYGRAIFARPSALSPQHCVRTADSRPPDSLPWRRRSAIVVVSPHCPALTCRRCGREGRKLLGQSPERG